MQQTEIFLLMFAEHYNYGKINNLTIRMFAEHLTINHNKSASEQ